MIMDVTRPSELVARSELSNAVLGHDDALIITLVPHHTANAVTARGRVYRGI